MQPRLALGLALACAGLAIAAVAVDLAYELQADLDTRDGADWQTVATTDETNPPDRGFFFPGCAGQDLRLRVHNDRLLAADVDVLISYSSASALGGSATLLQETWHLARGETRTHEFTIPDSAFTQQDGISKPFVNVNVQVDGSFLGACIEEDA